MTKGRWLAWAAAVVVAAATVVVALVTGPGKPAVSRERSSAATNTTRPSTSAEGHVHGPYHSRPDLPAAPTLQIKQTGHVDPGLLMNAPHQGHSGLLISDDNGQPVWFKPVAPGRTVGNLRVDTYRGKKVLTYFDGVGSGYYRGKWYLLNNAYQQIATISAGKGAQADLHDMLIRPDGTAIVECYTPVKQNLTKFGGPADGVVLETEIQQINIATGKVMFDWHSLDHIPVTESYATLKRSPVDYMHTNTLAMDPNNPDNVVVSARHLSQVFSLNLKTGKIDWSVGGKHPSMKLASGAVDTFKVDGVTLPFSFQHDAIMQPDGHLTLFDNGNQRVPMWSRSAAFSLNFATHTVTEINSESIRHKPDIYGKAHGSTQLLPGGHTMISWGTTGRATEYNSHNQPVMEITSTDSYRLLRQVWHGAPAARPALSASNSAGHTSVYVSWNGATDVASYQVLAGTSSATMRPVAVAKRAGFETAIRIPTASAVQVRARDSAGKVLGTSVVVPTQP